jgi:hypothetical protein
MGLLWATHLIVQNVQFTHLVPHHHVLTLTAKKIAGKKLLDIEDVKGQYADWLFAAKRLTLNTLDHVVQLRKMAMSCKNPCVKIHAQSGTLDLHSYNAVIQFAHLTHRNMLFTCPKAAYDHRRQKITCFHGQMVIKQNTHSRLNKEL